MLKEKEKKLLQKIEVLRKALNTLATHKAYTDPDVVLASQRLDHYLFQYYTLSQEKFEFEVKQTACLDQNSITVSCR